MTSTAPTKTTTTRYFKYPNKYSSAKSSYSKPSTTKSDTNKSTPVRKSVHFVDDLDSKAKSIDETKPPLAELGSGLVPHVDHNKDSTPLSHAINVDET